MFKNVRNLFVLAVSTAAVSLCAAANAADITAENGLVPLRQAAESVGYAVEWCNEDGSVEVYDEYTNVKIAIGSTEITADGVSASLTSAPILPDDTTYVPEDFFAALPRVYLNRIDGGYDVTECGTPSAENMIDTIATLSAAPRGIEDETHEEAKQYLIDTYTAFGYDVSTQEFELSPNTCTNIIAVKQPSVDATGDVLILCAHYDGERGMPAANDNGSGVSVLTEIARLVKDMPSDTEIRFILFDAEEEGLLGSNYYAENLDDSQNIIGVINFDMLGAAKAQMFGVHTGNGETNYLFDILRSVPQYSGLVLREQEYGISDYASFTPRAIPIMDISHEIISDEYHCENDVLENIGEDKLVFAAEYGMAVVKNVMSNITPSYLETARAAKPIETAELTADMYIERAGYADTISRHLGANLVQIESDNDKLKYKAYVKMFGTDITASLIYSGDTFGGSVGNPEIYFDDTDLTFDEVKTLFDETFGEGEYSSYYTGYSYIYRSIYGNMYTLIYVEDEDSFYIQISNIYTDDKEAYAVSDGGLVRMTNDDLYDIYHISNDGGDITVTADYCVPDESLDVSDRAAACWEKVKPYINDDMLGGISYVVIQTNGIGHTLPLNMSTRDWSNGISYSIGSTVDNPIPDEYKDLPETVLKYIKIIRLDEKYDYVPVELNGGVLYIDYLDLLNEEGTAYTAEGVMKAAAAAYCSDYLYEQCVTDGDYGEASYFEMNTYYYDKNSFAYAFADKFYQEIYNSDMYYTWDLYAKYPGEWVCEEAATTLNYDLSYSFAEFVAGDMPAGETVAEQKILFFYDYPELVAARTVFRQAAGLE